MSWFPCAPPACSSPLSLWFPPATSTNQSWPQCSGKLSPTPSQCGLSVCRRDYLSVSLYCVSNKFLKILPGVTASFTGLSRVVLLMLPPDFGVWGTSSMGLCATACSQGLGEVTDHPQTLSHRSPGLNVLLLTQQPHPENVVASGSCALK